MMKKASRTELVLTKAERQLEVRQFEAKRRPADRGEFSQLTKRPSISAVSILSSGTTGR